MKITELKKLDDKKLQEKLQDLRKKSRELKFSIANNQVKNVRELRQIKKDIAKILTLVNQAQEKNISSEDESKTAK